MNKIFLKIAALSFMLIYLAGCNDFLEKDVLGYSTDENFFDTQYKLQAALNATYDILQSNQFMDCEWRFGEATADDVWGTDEGLSSQMGQLVQFRFNTSNEWIHSRYEVNYRGIHRANQVIANAHKVELAIYEYASLKPVREILGQAKFLRALYYFNLVKTYGGVPIRPEIETVDNLVIPRNSAAEVYAYIEKDLREAAIMLPTTFTGTDAGKAGEGAAVALLMKVLMYQATPGERSDKWEEMVRLGDFFIDGSPMTFGEMLKFNTYEEDWETLRERLWFTHKELPDAADQKESVDTQLPALNTTYSLEYRDYYGVALTSYGAEYPYIAQFYNAGEFCRGSIFEVVFNESRDGSTGDANEGTNVYRELYPSGITAGMPIYTTAGILESLYGNDPRRSSTITHMQYSPDGETLQAIPGRYFSLKWYTPVKERPQNDGDDGKNRRLIRFVEVVLMYAEALNESGYGERAMQQLNKCKTQANTINNSTTLYTSSGYGYQRDQIWSERRKELAFEWDRFFDLVRQKRAAEVLKAYGLERSNRRGFYFREGVNEVFPIPQVEIDISHGVITQNPGY